MIDWITIVFWPLFGVAATEIGRRIRRRKSNEPSWQYTFLPLRVYYLICYVALVFCVFFWEAAQAALTTPTRSIIWLMIGSSAGAFCMLLLQMVLELRAARRQLQSALAPQSPQPLHGAPNSGNPSGQ